jgi:hypothetical protein
VGIDTRGQWSCGQANDYALFMTNARLCPDEVMRLENRDVEIIEYDAIDDTILEIVADGKRGVGPCTALDIAAINIRCEHSLKIISVRPEEPVSQFEDYFYGMIHDLRFMVRALFL